MKKILVSILLILAFALSSCEDDNTDDVKKDDKTPSGEVTYEKDGDVKKYFTTFGNEEKCNDGTDWNDESCFIIEETFDDGMTILMRYYGIEDSVYLTFDFIAELNGETVEIQTDYMQELDTSVKYYKGASFVEGFLQFNGYDQTPLFELNQNYSYTELGDDSVDLMHALLAKMILNLDSYYDEFIGTTFVSSE